MVKVLEFLLKNDHNLCKSCLKSLMKDKKWTTHEHEIDEN